VDLSRGGSGPERFLVEGMLYPPSASMIRASAIPPYGFDERMPYVSDWKIAMDCLMGGGAYGCVPGVYARYRRHDNNISTVRRAECFRDELVTLAVIEAEHPELARSCRARRARLYYRNAVSVALPAGDRDQARELMRLSFITAPERSWKLPLHYALTYVPEEARVSIVQRGHAALSRLRQLAAPR
jgi:hypothetical protein